MKEKKQKLKFRNPYAFYRNGFYACKLGKRASIITPFVTIFALNFDKYFLVDDGNGSQIKLTLGSIMALFIGGIAFWNETRKKGDGTHQSSPLTGVIGWAIAFGLAFFFQSILNDIVMILGAALVGQLAGLGFEFGAQNRYEYMKIAKRAKVESSMFSTQSKAAFNRIIGKETRPYE